jgi:hypothetical protein
MTKNSDALRLLEADPNLQAEIGFGGSLPVTMRLRGQLERENDGSYRFIAEADGVELTIQANSEAWNITDEGDAVTISKQAGRIDTYVRIRRAFD